MLNNPVILAQLVKDHLADLRTNKKVGFFSGKISLGQALGLLMLR